jgi:hypothetical protein
MASMDNESDRSRSGDNDRDRDHEYVYGERFGRENRPGAYSPTQGQYEQEDHERSSGYRNSASRYDCAYERGGREDVHGGPGYGRLGDRCPDPGYVTGGQYTGMGTGLGYGGRYPEQFAGTTGKTGERLRQDWRSRPYAGKGPKGYSRTDERIHGEITSG